MHYKTLLLFFPGTQEHLHDIHGWFNGSILETMMVKWKYAGLGRSFHPYFMSQFGFFKIKSDLFPLYIQRVKLAVQVWFYAGFSLIHSVKK